MSESPALPARTWMRSGPTSWPGLRRCGIDLLGAESIERDKAGDVSTRKDAVV
jgi:hypothetical protein